ncbi:MAG TPA: glycosyltransferase family 4 protein, partial [Rhizomicrobium sp.]
MIVHNNGTRDGRVMREAHSLQAAGHVVTVVGVPEGNATAPLEVLDDGITVHRVQWQERARQRLRRSALLRGPLFLALFAGGAYLLYRLVAWLARPAGPVAAAWELASANGHRRLAGTAILVLATVALAGMVAAAMAAIVRAWQYRAGTRDRIRRAVVAGEPCPTSRFPAIGSLIPNWMPDWLLEIAVEPLDWLGAKTGRFSMYRYRSEELAAAAIRLTPDIVHCHDCAALPTGWLVKKALGIPLVYDAHEIYEAVAARSFGVTHYFARVHQKYLRHVQGFVAVNDSAAIYYAHAFPTAPRAVVIRNATAVHTPTAPYDGRLHRAAGLLPDRKILLYQGGFTAHRGLETLVRAAALLPEDWSLVMMGWGALTGELKRIASEAGSAARAHIIRAVPAAELLEWTQGATAGIVPYE